MTSCFSCTPVLKMLNKSPVFKIEEVDASRAHLPGVTYILFTNLLMKRICDSVSGGRTVVRPYGLMLVFD